MHCALVGGFLHPRRSALHPAGKASDVSVLGTYYPGPHRGTGFYRKRVAPIVQVFDVPERSLRALLEK
jgi:hypothetical protein